jgi:hypothetical protein
LDERGVVFCPESGVVCASKMEKSLRRDLSRSISGIPIWIPKQVILAAIRAEIAPKCLDFGSKTCYIGY